MTKSDKIISNGYHQEIVTKEKEQIQVTDKVYLFKMFYLLCPLKIILFVFIYYSNSKQIKPFLCYNTSFCQDEFNFNVCYDYSLI